VDESRNKHRRRRSRSEAAAAEPQAAAPRRRRSFLRALSRRIRLPAFVWWIAAVCLLLLLGAGAGAYFLRSNPRQFEAQWREEFAEAMEAGEYQVAVERFHDLEDHELLTNKDVPLYLDVVRAHEKLKDQPGARRLMEALAQRKLPAAHLWLAKDELEQLQAEAKSLASRQSAGDAESRKKQTAIQKSAELHLASVLAQEPENIEANRLMSRINLAQRRWKQAAENLSRLAAESDENRLLLARIYNLDQQRERSTEEAKRVLASASKRARQDPTDEKSVSLAVAAALMLSQFPEANQLLENSLKNGLDTVQLRSLRSMTYLAWSQSVLRTGVANLPAAIDLLETSLSQQPVPLESFLLLIQLAPHRESAPRIKQLIQSSLARGYSPGLLHRMLGDLAEREKRTSEAMRHYQSAVDADPQEAVARNNLAWLLATGENPDLPRALKLANEALQISPNFVRFLDTRGQVLVRMGRDNEALPDLRTAVGLMPENVELHRALSGIYVRLKLLELASEHENRVRVILAAREEAKKEAKSPKKPAKPAEPPGEPPQD